MRELLAASRRHSYWYVLLLAVALLIANIAVLPNFASPSGLVVTLAEFAPIALIAMANTPAILSGGGGIDISVAATMNLVNVLYVAVLLPRGLGGAGVSAVLLLLLGGGIGACNGIMVAVLRYQPVIATIASSGRSSSGAGRSSTRTWPGAWKVTALMRRRLAARG